MKSKINILILCFLFISPLLMKGAQADPVDYGFLGKTVDSSVNGYMYGYGPTIIYDQSDGMFYLCYCSTGGTYNGAGGWDWLRFVTSPDGKLWSKPKIVVKVTDGTNERAACDPSLVYYDAGDGPFYYLFYSGNKENVQTVMFVSRSKNIRGPYEKYTQRGVWEVDAPDPKIIIQPKHPMPEGSGWYGAGQQTVLVKNDTMYSWFTDDTEFYPAHETHIYFSFTTNPTRWANITRTNLQGVASIDVKYDPARDEFVAFYLLDRHQNNARLARSFSADGITWGKAEIIADADNFPDWANNPGVSGDARGHLIGDDRTMVVYGAPYDLNAAYKNQGQAPYTWAYWDLYGSSINAAIPAWDDIPWGWQWPGMTIDYLFSTGDYDGDGIIDAAFVNVTRDDAKWYILSSATGEQGTPDIPWGWSWDVMHHYLYEPAVGDYDGDGVTDRAAYSSNTGVWYVLSSKTGEQGAPGIPWGWKTDGMNNSHDLLLFDFDGDGVTDRTFVNRATSQWYVFYSSPYSIYGDIVSVHDVARETSIDGYVLQQNYPNPFNPSTTIRYTLPQTARVVLAVYNLMGQKVRTLVDARQAPGARAVIWDGINEQGVRAPSGVYFYRLSATSNRRTFSAMKKMIVVK